MKNRRSAAVRALSVAAVAAVPSLVTRAQTWVPNSGTANWNVGSNWSTGVVPVNGTNTALVFGGSGSSGYLAFENVADPFNLNRMDLTTTATGPVIIGATSTASVSTATLQFGGTTPTINHTGTGDVYLTSDLNVGTTGVTVNVANTGRLIMLGDIANTTGGITKTGSGTLVWGWEGDVTPDVPGRGINVSLTGEVKVQAGTLQIGSIDGSFLSNGSLLTIASGATFDFHGNAEDFGSIQGQGTLQSNGAGFRVGLDNRSTTWEGSILGTSRSSTFNKDGTGTFTVSTPQSYWGIVRVGGGTMVLDKNGSWGAASEYIIDPGSVLKLDNTAQNNNQRISASEDASGFTINSGELVLVGSGSAGGTHEVLPPLFIKGDATVTIVPGAGQTAELSSVGLMRVAGGTVLFRGKNLGGTWGAADTASMTFSYQAPPLVGGGGAAGTPSVSILPYALGDTSATGLGSTLVTYDAVRGIRPLDVNTEFASYGAAAANQNARITAGASGLAGKTVNSLVVDNSTGAGITVAGTGTLTPASGAVLLTGSNPITVSGFDALDFGSAEAIISSANSHTNGATIASPIAGTAGLFKGGAGVLTLTGANTFSGNATVNGGTLRVSANNNLGAAANKVLFNGGSLQLAADLLTSRAIEANDGAIGTIDTNGFTLDYRGTFGGTGTLVKTGAGTLLLPEYGTGVGLTFNGGSIKVTKAASTGTNGRAFVLQGSPTSPINTFDTNGFDSVIGGVSGTGGMIKTGAGTLLMQGSNSFTGDINIVQGTVKIIGTAGSFFDDATYTNISAGATLDMSNNSEQWGGISGAGSIFTGTGSGVDVNVVGSRSATFSGTITGGGNFVKNGTATVTLSGANGYTGTTAVNSGTLIVTGNAPSGANGTLGNATSAVLLGNTSGSTAATMLIGAANVTVGRNFQLRSGGTLTLGSNHTSGVSTFSGNIPLTKALTVTAAAGGQTDFTGVISGTLTAANTALTKVGAGVVNLAGVNTYTNPTVVNAGTLRITGSATNTTSLTVNNTGTFEAASSQSLKSLVVNAGGTARITGATAGLTVGALTATAGKVDVGTGVLVVDYATTSPAAAVRAALTAGRGAAGDWKGTAGITSGAITDATTAVGYFEASALGATGGTYRGVTVDNTAVVVARTVLGDASMDGTVNFADLLALAKNYNATGATWSTGDFNYDGNVNFADLLALAKNYNRALAAPTPADVMAAGETAAFAADVSAAFAAVPEPSSAVVVLAGALGMGLGGRRRRKSAAR